MKKMTLQKFHKPYQLRRNPPELEDAFTYSGKLAYVTFRPRQIATSFLREITKNLQIFCGSQARGKWQKVWI